MPDLAQWMHRTSRGLPCLEPLVLKWCRKFAKAVLCYLTIWGDYLQSVAREKFSANEIIVRVNQKSFNPTVATFQDLHRDNEALPWKASLAADHQAARVQSHDHL
jgi:hypothetical protein